jgi:hypothetical protein
MRDGRRSRPDPERARRVEAGVFGPDAFEAGAIRRRFCSNDVSEELPGRGSSSPTSAMLDQGNLTSKREEPG